MTNNDEIKLNIWQKIGIYIIIQILVFDFFICMEKHSFINVPTFFQIVNIIISIFLWLFLFYLVFLALAFIIKCVVSMRLLLSFKTIKRISERKCNYDDIKELTSGLNYNNDKKELIEFVIKNYPEYISPYFWNNIEMFKDDCFADDVYDKIKKDNDDYPKTVSEIYKNIAKFRNQLNELLDRQFKDYWDKYVTRTK